MKNRIELYKLLERKRNSKLLVYYTSDRKGLETQIASDIIPIFTDHLDKIEDNGKISLFLYTRGGNTLAAWSLVNLMRNFCDDFEVIVPFNCHSAGTLISLGANRIVMTKQATLSPIDPSVNGPLNPQLPGNNPNARASVSVEFVNAYLEMARSELGIKDEQGLSNIIINLSNNIHPLTLGQVYRSKTQIQMLAKKLLKNHGLAKGKDEKVVRFLASESGSHDYTIYRNEAKDELGLNVEKPDDELYQIIRDIHLDIRNELDLLNPFDPKIILGSANNCTFQFKRALIESLNGGSDAFVSEGILFKQSVTQGQPVPVQQTVIQDNRTFEGWRHEDVEK